LHKLLKGLLKSFKFESGEMPTGLGCKGIFDNFKSIAKIAFKRETIALRWCRTGSRAETLPA